MQHVLVQIRKQNFFPRTPGSYLEHVAHVSAFQNSHQSKHYRPECIKAQNSIEHFQNMPIFLKIRTQKSKFRLKITYQRLNMFFKECVVNHSIFKAQNKTIIKQWSQHMPRYISFKTQNIKLQNRITKIGFNSRWFLL